MHSTGCGAWQPGELLLIKTNPVTAAAEVLIVATRCALLLSKGRFQRALRTVINPNPSGRLISDSSLRVMRNMRSISTTKESRKQRRPRSKPCFFCISRFSLEITVNSSAAQVFNLITASNICFLSLSLSLCLFVRQSRRHCAAGRVSR